MKSKIMLNNNVGQLDPSLDLSPVLTWQLLWLQSLDCQCFGSMHPCYNVDGTSLKQRLDNLAAKRNH